MSTPQHPPRRGPPRDVDSLIRELQRINLSQCLDQLNSDIGQLNSMERQLTKSWRGLSVRCPDPEHEADQVDKKSSSGYSTESASPTASNLSDESGNANQQDRESMLRDCRGGISKDLSRHPTEVAAKRHAFTGGAGFVNSLRELNCGDRPRGFSVRLLRDRSCEAIASPPWPASSPLNNCSSFCPPSASTPALDYRLPRSPKTLRFAATHELIPPGSSGRRKDLTITPRPGILRSRVATPLEGAECRSGGRGSFLRTGSLLRPARRESEQLSHSLLRHGSLPRPPVLHRRDCESPSPEPVRRSDDHRGRGEGPDRVGRVVSMLAQLEKDLCQTHRQHSGRSAVLSSGGMTSRQPPRRHLSFSGTGSGQTIDPALTQPASTSDLDDSSGDEDNAEAHVDLLQRPDRHPMSGSVDFDSLSNRHCRLPPRGRHKSSGPKFSDLFLMCGSRRRPPSPPGSSSSIYRPPPAVADGSTSSSSDSSAPYQCNLCSCRFVARSLLVTHVHERHLRVQVRPKYRCAACPARFYASKVLAKHCAFHHCSMGDKRRPHCLSDHPQSR